MTTALYRVHTQPVSVGVNLGQGCNLEGQMFLRPSILTESGVETVADRMNDQDAFFPLRVSAPTVSTQLVSKAQVRYVVASAEGTTAAGTSDEGAELSSYRVTLELDSGEMLEGVFRASLPAGKRRALDFINAQAGAFAALFSANRVHVINRAFVRRIVEAGA